MSLVYPCLLTSKCDEKDFSRALVMPESLKRRGNWVVGVRMGSLGLEDAAASAEMIVLTALIHVSQIRWKRWEDGGKVGLP